MEQKVKELERDISLIKDEQFKTGSILVKIEETLSKVAQNQEKMIHFEHNLNSVKKDLLHLKDMYEGKLKGIKELTEKDDRQLKDDFISIKDELKDVKATLKNVMLALLGTLGTALASLILGQLGVNL